MSTCVCVHASVHRRKKMTLCRLWTTTSRL